VPIRRIELNRLPILEDLKDAVGGYIEVVPDFDTIIQDSQVRPCVAFCNEEGKLKQLPINIWAQTLWVQSLTRKYGFNQSDPRDVLVGDICVVTGDAEFLESL
jgi:hypothetical protein